MENSSSHVVVVVDLEEVERVDESCSSLEYSDAEDCGVLSECEGEEDEEEECSNGLCVGGEEINLGGSSEGSLELDLESGIVEKKVHLGKVKRDCRICHLSFDGSNPESGVPVELGCSCKEDLAAAHKQCAEAWFKIRGNKTCEICGSIARNIVGANDIELMEQWNEANEVTPTAPAPARQSEARHFWQGHRFLNFLLACMVFGFVISWLFHFKVPS